MPDPDNRLVEVEKKVAAQEALVTRFDIALDKISEVSLNVSKLLAAHEQRIENTEYITKEMSALVEERRKEFDSRVGDVYDRIAQNDQELRREMADGQKEIILEIKSLRGEVEEMGDSLSARTDNMKSAIESDFNKKMDTVTTRVTKLERLAYIVIGAASILGFVIAQAVGILQVWKP